MFYFAMYIPCECFSGFKGGGGKLNLTLYLE